MKDSKMEYGFKKLSEIIDKNHPGPSEADFFIPLIHRRQVELIRKKGRKDWRAILMVVFTILAISALLLWNLLSVPLFFGALLAVDFGKKIHQEICLINLEIEAANKLLGELFKIKVQGRFSRLYNDNQPFQPGPASSVTA